MEGWSDGRRYELRRSLAGSGIRMVFFKVFNVVSLRCKLAFMAVTMPDNSVLALVVEPLLAGPIEAIGVRTVFVGAVVRLEVVYDM
jgi:hypothetical protein